MLTKEETHIIDNPAHKRYITLDFARGIAIFCMIALHTVMSVLDINHLTSESVIVTLPILNLVALFVLPFLGGLAGFFLLISSTSNMLSMYKHLERGKSIRSLVIKQIVSGFVLLLIAMLIEGLLGYYGVVGSFFNNLNNPANTNWQNILHRWNHFETIHTIAWCLMINGVVQGLLSLKEHWKKRTNMIIAYAVLALVVLALTYPIWLLVAKIVPGFPFGTFPSGHRLDDPWIGTESFWQIIRTPFLNALAGDIEPIFPYLATSFIGSIIGICLSKPKEKISKNLPRRFLLIGLGMFIIGMTILIFAFVNIMNASNIDDALGFYQELPFHRHMSPDRNSLYPAYGWLGQYLAVNGFSIMALMLLFRLVEFRGRSKIFAKNTVIIRRFGTIALTNYTMQSIYRLMWFFTSLMLTQQFYQKFYWGGTLLTIVFTLGTYILIHWGWEKIGYIGSLEWFIRTITNNALPVKRDRFPEGTKWWQRGKIDVENTFYNAQWIDIEEPYEEEITADALKERKDSKFALLLSIVGLTSILFVLVSFIGLVVSISARKREGKNNLNTAAFSISIVTIVLLVAFSIVTSILKIGLLGIF